MLGRLEYLRLPHHAVTTPECSQSAGKATLAEERGILRDLTPGEPREGSKVKSDLHGDMQRPAEMAGPHGARRGATTVSEIPCRVSNIAQSGSDPARKAPAQIGGARPTL